MKRSYLAAGALAFLLIAGVGCSKQPAANKATGPEEKNQTSSDGWTPKTLSPEAYDDSDQIFEDKGTGLSFHFMGYLQKTDMKAASGSVSFVLKRREGSTRPIDTLYFSMKTRAAYLAEKAAAPKNISCDSYDKPGCDKWEDDLVLYNRAMSQNNFDGYFALGSNRVTMNGITYAVVVDYNLDRQQYQTRYIAFINDTRIVFRDPATGGLEYGVPFQMNARNRELIEKTAQKIAKRQKIDDQKTYDRANALYQLVATLKIAK